MKPIANSHTMPSHTNAMPPAPAKGGVSKGVVESQSPSVRRVTERPPMREVYAKELAWAEANLPDEYGPFVALAIESVKRQGLKPSTATVMDHLRAIGRDAGSRNV